MRRKDREITDRAELEAILDQADVCRLALAVDDWPYLVTLNYGYRPGDRPALFFHSANQGQKLDMIRQNNRACFQVTVGHRLIETRIRCNCGMEYRSVVGRGRIYFVTDPAEKIDGLNAVVHHYHGQDRPRYNEAYVRAVTVLRLDIEELTGKQCTGPAEPDPDLPID